MSLVRRFSAAEEQPSPKRAAYNRSQRSHSDHIQKIQTVLRRIRADPELDQDKIFRQYAPAFIFACLLGAGAATSLKLGLVEPHNWSCIALTIAAVLLVSVVFALLVLLRVTIWGIACAVDAFLETDWEAREEQRHLQLDTHSLLFGGMFS